jgi:hypothetical protein
MKQSQGNRKEVSINFVCSFILATKKGIFAVMRALLFQDYNYKSMLQHLSRSLHQFPHVMHQLCQFLQLLAAVYMPSFLLTTGHT